jgi:dUTP pyrophosphatase
MKVKFKKLTEDAVIPCYGSDKAAGLDMTATDVKVTYDYIEYSTGIAMEIPEGYAGFIFPRSSLSKMDLSLCNSVGIIDSDYRGEVKFRFNELESGNEFLPKKVYKYGDRIGQLIIMPVPEIRPIEVKELSSTVRGEGGFGHTGR